MKGSRRSSSTCTECLFLHVLKHNLLFCFSFFSMWLFLTNIHDSQDSRWISLYLFYHFHPLYRHLDIRWVIAAESSPLHIAGSWNRKWNLWCTLFRIHSFYTCTGSCFCRRMLKTCVRLENISRVLPNLTKRLIFAMFKESSSFPISRS